MYKKSSIARIAIFFCLALFMLLGLYAPSATTATAQEPTPTPEGSVRVVGGAPADPGEWPWQVALIDGSTSDLYYGQFCGGSLISS